jgi:acetoacetyl-CoA synthetase
VDKPIWEPSAERMARTNMTAFMAALKQGLGLHITDYPSLYSFSIEHPDKFWASVWDFCGIIAETRGDEVVRDLNQMPGATWFPQARLNFAENLLRRRDAIDALVYLREDRAASRISFAKLYDEVSRIAQALKAAGVEPGDRVAGFLPNMPETVIAMLGATTLGAVWCACSPDFGAEAAVDRFGQVDPKVLFASDGYAYNGQLHDSIEKTAMIADRLPTLGKVVMVPNIHQRGPRLDKVRHAVLWEEFLNAYAPAEIRFEQFPFNHPVFILYSSGTTGAPKCIVHGAGGTLLENLKGQGLHFDVKSGDRIFWWTTTGWVVWHFMVFSLGCGATLLLYDGSPSYPSPSVLIDFAAAERATFVRLSPQLVEAMAKSGLEPVKSHDLSSLKTITAAGAPFSAAGYDYIYNKVKRDVHLASPSGGTDPMASLVTGNPIGPVWPGEIQTRGLGIKVEVFDQQGKSVIGKPGELVVTMPFPSMPLGFWNDADNATYRATYFEAYPNVWRQGDWAELTRRGGMIIYGRSDATLKARGIRIGTAEIYRQMEHIAEVVDSVVVSQDWQGSSRIILFVQLREGKILDDLLIASIRTRIRAHASPRHVPDKVIQVADIPRTRTGKVSELAVRDVIHGRDVKNCDALRNPKALLEFSLERLPELAV